MVITTISSYLYFDVGILRQEYNLSVRPIIIALAPVYHTANHVLNYAIPTSQHNMQNVDKTFIACFQQCSNPNTTYKTQQPQREAKALPPSVQTPQE